MISVCMATHNGEKYIKEQIASILVQMSDNDELIISDDGSTDGTISIIQSFDDTRIKLINKKHDKVGMKAHYYVTKNFENALNEAKGDIIFLSDQDDIWMPNKVEECLLALENHIAVLHNLHCVNENSTLLGYLWYNKNHRFKRYNFFMCNGKHMGCALAFKKELLSKVLPFPRRLVIHDFWIGIMAECKGQFCFLDKPLMKYRIHANNTSGRSHKRNSILYMIFYRAYTIFHLWLRIIGVHKII